jgi:Zn-dependent M28 family amino/carboxypeptidase
VWAGADDNASGTAAMLSVARAFGAGKVATRRSLVFAAFSAEERGLLGSEAFAKDCPVPLVDVVAMLQMDMVGRARDGRLHLLGAGYNRDLCDALRKAAVVRPVALKLDWDENDNLTRRFWERSDQYSFAKRGVPAVFFFTGEHPDYHKPLDTPEKIEAKALAEVGKLAFNLAHVLANQDGRPAPGQPPEGR